MNIEWLLNTLYNTWTCMIIINAGIYRGPDIGKLQEMCKYALVPPLKNKIYPRTPNPPPPGKKFLIRAWIYTLHYIQFNFLAIQDSI